MKFIHTGDWHLGRLYRRRDLTDAILKQVSQLGEVARERKADAIVVAGDVFDFQYRRDMAPATRALVEVLAPLVRDGIELLLMPGNHDNADHFAMMEALLSLELGPATRRVHVVRENEIVEIRGVQFGVVPYPSRAALLGHSNGEKPDPNQAFARLVRGVWEQFDPQKRAVLVAHVTVAGVTTPGGWEIEAWNDLRLGRDNLPTNPSVAYVALGHIHQQQEIKHTVPTWYCGSVERLSMGERGDNKGALWVEVPESGPARVEPIALDATPFHHLYVRADEIEELPTRFPDLERAFVRVEVREVGERDPAQIVRRLRALCPNLVEWDIERAARVEADLRPQALENKTETVLSFLRREFAADSDLPDLELRARRLMEEVF